MAFLQCEKTPPMPKCSARRNGHGVAGCLAGRCEIDRGWSTLSPVQHGETAVIRGYDAGAAGRQAASALEFLAVAVAVARIQTPHSSGSSQAGRAMALRYLRSQAIGLQGWQGKLLAAQKRESHQPWGTIIWMPNSSASFAMSKGSS